MPDQLKDDKEFQVEIEIVATQTGASKELAHLILEKNNRDIVNAIMELSMELSMDPNLVNFVTK